MNFNPNTAQTICQILIFVFAILTAASWYGSYHFGNKVQEQQFNEAQKDRADKRDAVFSKIEQTQTVSPEEQEKLRPKFEVKLFTSPNKLKRPDGTSVPISTRYKYPLVEYRLLISNTNNNSVIATDFRILFFFSNQIVEINNLPLMSSSQGAQVEAIRMYKEDTKGNSSLYEEKQQDNTITNNLSLQIKKINSNGKEINSNIATFSCPRWPREVNFSASIIIDVSKTMAIEKTPSKLSTFEGKYFYEIKGNLFEERINGKIPDDE